MVGGGYDSDSSRINSFETISSELSMNDKKLVELPYGISGRPSIFLHGDNLLLCGGFNNINKCLKYENDTWKEHSILNEGRTYASVVTTADGTFIFGGDGNFARYNFEFLPKNSMVWQEGRTKIPDGFTTGCLVEVPYKQKILLIGGSDTETRILKFDIETQTFEEMAVSLLKERYSHTCAKLPDKNLIVITGGYSNGNTHGTSEIFNLEDNTITSGNPMNTKRYAHGMAVITIDNEDRLAVFGGDRDNYHYLDSVETLNPRTKKWEISDLKLEKAKENFGYISLPNDFISKL